jgi:sialic acid synthase SpsE
MGLQKNFTVSHFPIGKNHPPFLVAEIGLNHNNDLEVGKKTIQAAKKAGAHAVKFQSYKTEEFIDPKNPDAKFLFDIFKNYELSLDTHKEFQKIAHEEGLVFFSTPLCESSVDLLESLDVPIYKIASGDIVNKPLLQKVSKTQKPIFLSTGAADFFEITRAVEFLESQSVEKLALFHCVSMYPTPPAKVNLQKISLLQSMYEIPIGFSDHSAGFLASSIAVGMGTCLIEKHFTLDKNLDGPDHAISLDPKEFSELSQSVQFAFEMKGELHRSPWKEEVDGRFFGRRSSYTYNGRVLTLRPALHLRDNSVLDSWNMEKSNHLSENCPEGPIRF